MNQMHSFQGKAKGPRKVCQQGPQVYRYGPDYNGRG